MCKLCGRSSGVERNLAKVEVEGSNPFARSKFLKLVIRDNYIDTRDLKMTYHSLFSGWFSLFGTRGRITHILVLIFAWLVFSITFIFISLYGGLGFSILLIGFKFIAKGNYKTSFMGFLISIYLIVNFFWTSICVTTQRLRHIGFNGIVLFILIF